MNGIMQAVDDLNIRLHHRSLMESSGLYSILDLARSFSIPVIDKQLELFQQTLDEDQENLEESMSLDSRCDLRSIDEVFGILRERTQDSKAQDYLLSVLQHLLYIRQDDPTFVNRFQLIDTLVADLVMDEKLGGGEKRLGLSVERIVAQLDSVQMATHFEEELVKTHSTMMQLKAENEDLSDRLAYSESLVGTLQAEVARLQTAVPRSIPESPKALKSGFVDTSLKENLPPGSQPSTPSSAPRLNFRGFASWFAATPPNDTPPLATATMRTPVHPSDYFGDSSMANTG